MDDAAVNAEQPGTDGSPDEIEHVRPHRAMRNAGILGAVALLVLGALLLAGLRGSSDGGTGSESLPTRPIQEFPLGDRPEVGDFTGRLLDGTDFDSTSLRGRVVVYNLWGSWCAPCRKEAPALAAVAEEFADSATFVGITVRDNPAAARAFEERYGIPYGSVSPDDSTDALLALSPVLNAAAIPSTLVLDRQGRVYARAIGAVTEATLRALVSGAVAEPSG